jgi:soluble lytic murein transglycosylase-like protein
MEEGTVQTVGASRRNSGWLAGAARCAAPLAMAAWLAAMPWRGQAAEVYASQGADGSVRYASQRVDASYVLLFSESGAASAGAAAAQQPRANARAQHLRPLIEQAAARHGLPAALVEAVVAVESGFNAQAVSPKGARGPMQLMPATARQYGLTDARQLHEPARNIDAGARHLKELLDRHQGNVALALAAYNAGAGAVQRHGSRIPPYAETMLYVPAVLSRSLPHPRP